MYFWCICHVSRKKKGTNLNKLSIRNEQSNEVFCIKTLRLKRLKKCTEIKRGVWFFKGGVVCCPNNSISIFSFLLYSKNLIFFMFSGYFSSNCAITVFCQYDKHTHSCGSFFLPPEVLSVAQLDITFTLLIEHSLLFHSPWLLVQNLTVQAFLSSMIGLSLCLIQKFLLYFHSSMPGFHYINYQQWLILC